MVHTDDCSLAAWAALRLGDAQQYAQQYALETTVMLGPKRIVHSACIGHRTATWAMCLIIGFAPLAICLHALIRFARFGGRINYSPFTECHSRGSGIFTSGSFHNELDSLAWGLHWRLFGSWSVSVATAFKVSADNWLLPALCPYYGWLQLIFGLFSSGVSSSWGLSLKAKFWLLSLSFHDQVELKDSPLEHFHRDHNEE